VGEETVDGSVDRCEEDAYVKGTSRGRRVLAMVFVFLENTLR
jgi:hypothetical protein